MRDWQKELESEVEFWHSMIESLSLKRDTPEFNRIQDALALAKFKLQRYGGEQTQPNLKYH
jgi:hypothetical protein